LPSLTLAGFGYAYITRLSVSGGSGNFELKLH